MRDPSIFKKYYKLEEFFDFYVGNEKNGVDVIIPIIHTNELWESNLLSIYREIPVHTLYLGDGGCIDDSLVTAKKFPRVKVLDHKQFTTLGYSIRKLIEAVETPWFVYLHSDVFLPPGWFKTMQQNKTKYDWFECRQHLTVLVDYPVDYTNYNRPLSGSQMGKKEVFEKILPIIEDDFLYRNEDIIIAQLVQGQGYRYGRVEETFHYHQMMNKDSKWHRKIKQVSFTMDKSPEEELREFTMAVKGLIKYTPPKPLHIEGVTAALTVLQGMKGFDWEVFQAWVREKYPAWQPYIKRKAAKSLLQNILGRIYRMLFR